MTALYWEKPRDNEIVVAYNEALEWISGYYNGCRFRIWQYGNAGINIELDITPTITLKLDVFTCERYYAESVTMFELVNGEYELTRLHDISFIGSLAPKVQVWCGSPLDILDELYNLVVVCEVIPEKVYKRFWDKFFGALTVEMIAGNVAYLVYDNPISGTVTMTGSRYRAIPESELYNYKRYSFSCLTTIKPELDSDKRLTV